MKKLLTILLFSINSLSAQELPFAQPVPIDSLKLALQLTNNDTIRLVLTNRIQNYYFINNANLDSALHYAKHLLSLAQKLHYKIDEAYALDAIGLYMNFMIQPQTLETLFQGIRIAENPRSEKHILPKKYLRMMLYWQQDFTTTLAKNDWHPQFYRTLILGSLYNDLGAAYANTISNQPKAFYYLYKAIDIFQSHKALLDLGVAYFDIANYFASINQYDSCIHYAQKSNVLNLEKSHPLYVAPTALIGTMYYKKGAVQKALAFLRQSIESNSKYGQIGFWLPYYTLAEYHYSKGNTDSSLYYCKKAYAATSPTVRPADVQKASALLAKVYKAAQMPDSAAKYYDITLSYNDIINNIDRKRALQTQDFDEQLHQQEIVTTRNKIRIYFLLGGLSVLAFTAILLWVNSRRRKKINVLLQQQKEKVEKTLDELKSMQAQLIQSEKMASLGELTAGVAHEIQNPLNFVNNFSDLNTELLDELNLEVDKGNIDEVKSIAETIKENEQKINHHGKRADAIVKGMLQHSRSSEGHKEPTDINALADEYLRLSYHGLRGKGQLNNVFMETDFDKSIGLINIVPQDIGRVLLNLYNNAFYAVTQKQKQQTESYQPTVTVNTKKQNDKIEITIKDNGNGIPDSLQNKIFQPFFTTKPTGQGTGLGLSLSYDIVKAHGGEIKLESTEGEGTMFTICLKASG